MLTHICGCTTTAACWLPMTTTRILELASVCRPRSTWCWMPVATGSGLVTIRSSRG